MSGRFYQIPRMGRTPRWSAVQVGWRQNYQVAGQNDGDADGGVRRPVVAFEKGGQYQSDDRHQQRSIGRILSTDAAD